jgi:arylformamidase
MRPKWSELSQAERDVAYDNNRAMANSASLIEQRNAASAAFRQVHADHLDVPYGPKERTKFDLYPSNDSGAPCLVFIHGGYWQRNRREDFAAFASGMMTHGWSVAMPGYSLSPDVTLTEIAAEIDEALTWLAAHGQEHGLARGPIVVSGWSAGGHLAAMAATPGHRCRRRHLRRVRYGADPPNVSQ